VTKDHSIFCLNKGKIISKNSTELKKDDYTRVIQSVYDKVILPRQTAKIISSKAANVHIVDAEVVDGN
jgi:hypothetical protein